MEVTYVNVPKAVIIKQNVVPKNVNIITKKIKLHKISLPFGTLDNISFYRKNSGKIS